MELIGLLNDKDIGDSTLTAAPPAVYALEPNILTTADRDELKSLDDAEVSNWDKAIDRLYWLSRNPGTDGLDDATSSSASPGKGTGRISNTDGGKALENDGYYVGLQGKVKRDPTTQKPEFEQIGSVDVVKRFDNLVSLSWVLAPSCYCSQRWFSGSFEYQSSKYQLDYRC